MKTLSALALVALLAGCHFDKLFSAGERPVSHGTPVGLTFYTTLGTARAGQRITPPVQVGIVDSVGNPIAGVDSAVAITLGANPGGARLSGTDTVAAVNGVATFADLHIDRPASGYTLTATGAGLPAITSAEFAVDPGPPDTLRFTTQPGGAMADSAIKPPVQVAAFDSLGNAATNFTGAVRLTLGNGTSGATLSGGGPVNAVAGVATFPNLRVDRSGTGYTLRAAFGTAAPLAESAPFAISPTPPPPPPTGDLSVTTATTGPSQDPDGYTVSVDGGQQSRSIPTSGTVTFQGLTAGNHTVTLSGVATNCTVSGGPSQQATVPASSVGTVTFSVSCSATTGSITVTTSTSGSPEDPDGYTVTVDGAQSQPIANTGSATFLDLASSNHSVALSGVAPNCSVSGGPSRVVGVTAGGNTQVPFTITCAPPPNQPPVVTAGSKQNEITGIAVSLQGASFSDPDHDGPWSVTIDWDDGNSSQFTMTSEGSIDATHTYVVVLPTEFHVTITVEDAHGARGSASKTIAVALL